MDDNDTRQGQQKHKRRASGRARDVIRLES